MAADGVSCTNSSRITDRFPELKAAVPWAKGYPSINCDGIEMLHFRKYPHEWLNTSEDAIRALTSPTFARVADVISFNTGLHINPEPKYRSILEYVVPLLERFAVLPGKVVIFRGTTAQHFAGSKSGDYEKRSGESCDSTRIPKEPSFRATVLKSFGQSRLGVMMVEQLWELTQERFDMHIGKPGDCTHFCYCPSFWRGIFSNLYLQLEQHLYEKATVEGPAAALLGVWRAAALQTMPPGTPGPEPHQHARNSADADGTPTPQPPPQRSRASRQSPGALTGLLAAAALATLVLHAAPPDHSQVAARATARVSRHLP